MTGQKQPPMVLDPLQPKALDPLQREAVAWVQRLVSGQATGEDAEALKLWRSQSAAHVAAFAEASRAWGDVAPAGRALRRRGGEMAASLADFRIRREVTGREVMARRAFLGGGLAAASAAAAYAMIRPPFDLWPSLPELTAEYRTKTGEQENVVVAGDVSVRLNTRTSVALRSSSDTADRVELVSGEASFDMARQARRSLVVLADDGQAIASDSRFSMRHIDDESGQSVCVTCFDGEVRIEQRNNAVTLGPAQQVRYDTAGLGQILQIDPEVMSAWQRGIVIFHATPLAEVVAEINRYRPGRIILLNAELGRKPVSGRFRIDHMDEILTRLERAFNAKPQALPGGIVLLS